MLVRPRGDVEGAILRRTPRQIALQGHRAVSVGGIVEGAGKRLWAARDLVTFFASGKAGIAEDRSVTVVLHVILLRGQAGARQDRASGRRANEHGGVSALHSGAAACVALETRDRARFARHLAGAIVAVGRA